MPEPIQEANNKIEHSQPEAVWQPDLGNRENARDALIREAILSQQTKSIQEPKQESAIGDFFHSLGYAGLQAPSHGIAQLVDKVAGSDLESKVQFMNPPEQAEFGSTRWHSQQVGGALGMLAPFLLTAKATRGAMGKVGLRAAPAELGILSSQKLLSARNGLAVTEGALTGFAFDFTMRPATPEEGEFWMARTKHGMVGAATFGTLTASSLGLRHSVRTLAPELLSSRKLVSDISLGTLSGVPAGLASAESHSLLFKGEFASGKERAQAAYTMAFIGGTLSAMHQLPGQRRSIADRAVENSNQRSGLDILSRNLQAKEGTQNQTGFESNTTIPGLSNIASVRGRGLASTDGKPEARPEAKLEAKPEAKPEAKLEAKSEAKPEAAPESRVDTKAEPKQENYEFRDVEIKLPAKELKPVYEQTVSLAYEAGSPSATAAQTAKFFEFARNEGAPLKDAMLDTARATGDARFLALVREAYLPAEGVRHIIVDKIRVGDPSKPVTEAEVGKWNEFNRLVQELPTDAGSYAKFRLDMFKIVHEAKNDPATERVADWIQQYARQTQFSQVAGPVDFYFGTSNLGRFFEVHQGNRAPVELQTKSEARPDPNAGEASITKPAEVQVTRVQPDNVSEPRPGQPRQYERPLFDVDARINSMMTPNNRTAVTDAVLLSNHTARMSESQFVRWLEIVQEPAQTGGISARSMLSRSDVLTRPEVARALENSRTGKSEPGDIPLESLRQFLSKPASETNGLPENIAEFVRIRIALSEATAKAETPPHAILDQAIPRWLQENIQAKLVEMPELPGQTPIYSKLMPPELATLMEAARISRGREASRPRSEQNNDIELRLARLSDVLEISNPIIRERMLELGKQDQLSIRNLTNKLNPERNAPEYAELLELVMPGAQRITDVKTLLDSLYFGNKADRDSRPPRRNQQSDTPAPDQARLEQAAQQAQANKQLANVLIDSMITIEGPARARAKEIAEGIITGRIRDPRFERDGTPFQRDNHGAPGNRAGANSVVREATHGQATLGETRGKAPHSEAVIQETPKSVEPEVRTSTQATTGNAPESRAPETRPGNPSEQASLPLPENGPRQGATKRQERVDYEGMLEGRQTKRENKPDQRKDRGGAKNWQRFMEEGSD